jgi:hypothetical protein
MHQRQKYLCGTAAFALVSLAAIVAGVRALVAYEATPGSVGATPLTWPETEVQRASDRLTLVMFAHPHCPCTRASVAELAQVMARVHGSVQAFVFFSKPATAGAAWDTGPLRQQAAAIPGVTVLDDTEGADAKRFGAETSGHTLLFGGDGRVLFSGGITASRGHAGDNAGASAIVSLVHKQTAERGRTFVFGCSLPAAQEPIALARK